MLDLVKIIEEIAKETEWLYNNEKDDSCLAGEEWSFTEELICEVSGYRIAMSHKEISYDLFSKICFSVCVCNDNESFCESYVFHNSYYEAVKEKEISFIAGDFIEGRMQDKLIELFYYICAIHEKFPNDQYPE